MYSDGNSVEFVKILGPIIVKRLVLYSNLDWGYIQPVFTVSNISVFAIGGELDSERWSGSLDNCGDFGGFRQSGSCRQIRSCR